MYKLAGSISKAIKNYRKQNNEVKRLVIHFYKTMSNRELAPIKKELHEMGLDIPVIIITINKTESKDLVLFDLNCPELITVSGTFISIGRNQFLLCNNTRYENTLPKSTEGYPFPIKLGISASDEKLLEDDRLIKDLIDQVYQFSRMYWKSVRQQNLPVTIKYPEMVAEIFPHFESSTMPEFGKNNLWFL
jgi:argonaute-like protein implicated in RNA metabolism and viral defense